MNDPRADGPGGLADALKKFSRTIFFSFLADIRWFYHSRYFSSILNNNNEIITTLLQLVSFFTCVERT